MSLTCSYTWMWDPLEFGLEFTTEARLSLRLGRAEKLFRKQVFYPRMLNQEEASCLEPNSTLIWTVDDGNEVHMISSTQAPQKHQNFVSHVLGLPVNKVVYKMKRLRGWLLWVGDKINIHSCSRCCAIIPLAASCEDHNG
eukprot:Gb_03575 [translate_table: standard]